MPKFISEHELPADKTVEDWIQIAMSANKAVRDAGGTLVWLNAWITDESLFCASVADSDEDVYTFVETYGMPPLKKTSKIKFEFNPGMVGIPF